MAHDDPPATAFTEPGRAEVPAGLDPTEPRTGYRWVICALVFAATTINYVDRGVLGVLAKELQDRLGWSDTTYGNVNGAFSFAYAIGFLLLGRFIDRVGPKIGYTVSLVVWSLAAAGHALASSAFGFGVARFFLGLGEAGNFPAAIRTTAEWFPRRERAFTTGIFNAGTNVGAVLAPLLVPVITLRFGWQAAFLITGLVGLVWVLFWWPLYDSPERHPRVSAAELAWIRSDPPEPKWHVAWHELLGYRQTWAFAVGKFLTDPIWWFYLTWSAKFLSDRFHVDLKHIGPPLVTIYLLADVGSVFGGWLSLWMIRRGWSTNVARKFTLTVCAFCVTPVSMVPLMTNMWAAVLLIGLAAAAHQGFSANLFTLTSDCFPRRAVGSAVGIGGMSGAVAGILMQLASGRILDRTKSYLPMFIVAGSVYLLSVVFIHLLAPRLEPVRLEPADQTADAI